MHRHVILLIETATTSCSVALSENGKIIAAKEANERNIHASHITLFIDEVISDSGKQYSDLKAVAVSKGPGSYTGLRIGVSTAKGICYALDIPLLSVNTLQAMANGLMQKESVPPTAFLIPMIDARRMEVYTAIYRSDLSLVEEVVAKIVDASSFDHLRGHELILFGDGSGKFKEIFSGRENIKFSEFTNSASHLASLAHEKLLRGETENIAYFEPFYLKDFVTISKM